MMEKICKQCGLLKALEGFYVNTHARDGRYSKCQTCVRKNVAQNYRERIEHYRAYGRIRVQLPQRKKNALRYQSVSRARNPERYQARGAINNAVRAGRMTRLPCGECGNPKSEAHHPDYSQPLNVQWLCFACHRKAHGQETASCERI